MIFRALLCAGFYFLAINQLAACDLTNANCRALQFAGLSPKLMSEIRTRLDASGPNCPTLDVMACA